MKREILQGIGLGLVLVFCVASIGSFIGFQLSHTPPAAAEQPAAEQPAAEQPAAEQPAP